MQIDILSLFPEYFAGPFDVSMIQRAKDNGLVDLSLINIRDFSHDKHNKVDDRPFGGGPGMVLAPQPVADAIRSRRKEGKSHVIYFSPQGKPLTAKRCEKLAEKEHLILLCGHYEGIDERVIEKEVDEEISIGDFVLTNGCIPAICLVDAVLRFIPGMLGHPESAANDTFQEGIFDAPHYTRPEVFEEMAVPDVLLSGHHAQIDQWRLEMSLKKTQKCRPDLYAKYLVDQKQNKEKPL